MPNPSRRAIILYWVLTLFVALNQVWAGVSHLLRAQPLFGVLQHLGYPPHFATLLGIGKLLGAVILVAPRRPLLKEWAYAGLFIDFSAGLVAHAVAGDGAKWYAGPILSLIALAGSWYLRPAPRRLALLATS
jgi:hypothetical protein